MDDDSELSEEENTDLLGKKDRGNKAKITNYRRLIIGGVVLVFVDLLWVGSAELSDFIFHNEGFDKPFFTTYFKTTAFVLYLPLVWIKSFCQKHRANAGKTTLNSSETLFQVNSETIDNKNDDIYCERSQYLRTENHTDFVPVQKLAIVKVMKIALIFCILWFLATLSYQEALALTSPAAVNILSSSSGLFTLILAAIFQSSQNDRFSYSKLIAVFMSITGIVLVTFSDSTQTKGGVNYGAFFSLGGAILYSCYLVLLKVKVPNESQIDIATFFGFVGLFNILFLWPGFWILHVTNIEKFELPQDWQVWCSLAVNAIFGTVLSEYLWLWGCYLTSSLSATLALGMVMPLTMLTDILRGRIQLSFMFVAGSIPVFLAFFMITYLCHYEGWDPVRTAFFSIYHCCKQQAIQPS
ncbi:solute carrier family 35 member F5-like [Dendronephthya gigantea]|uniref:solute carrier family 35 member F5-like n=1 Tax=Dendronephthya gigantea TaxID=151771 RepID=UPI00106B5423|nr:solute carrier family 35 member F5-like [Dendronephthya gigantea]